MKKVIDKYIPAAIELIGGKKGEVELIAKQDRMSKDDGKVPSEFRGYISAFGASLIQAGLVPTLAFYGDENADSAQDRWKLLIVIYHLLKEEERWEKGFVDMDSKISDKQKLFRLALKQEGQDLRRFKQDITNAAIALKLALRTYSLIKKEQ